MEVNNIIITIIQTHHEINNHTGAGGYDSSSQEIMNSCAPCMAFQELVVCCYIIHNHNYHNEGLTFQEGIVAYGAQYKATS